MIGDDATPQKLAPVLYQLESHGLLYNAEAIPGKKQKQNVVQNLLALHLASWNPDMLLIGIVKAVQILAGKPGRVLVGVLSSVGLLAALNSIADFQAGLAVPLHGWSLLWLIVAAIIFMALHKLAHALMLKYYGGRVTQVGVMLLYLLPAMSPTLLTSGG